MKKDDVYETFTHMVLGMIVNGYITYLIFGTTLIEAIGVTAIFFVASFLRTLATRVAFRKYYEARG